ncbi:MAG: hypothetical protein DRN27_10300 [Thermoplasmata archaeon]|nr:MAG: hypothetical protein DRN27_10300 [Thermoplasmata archaeon]
MTKTNIHQKIEVKMNPMGFILWKIVAFEVSESFKDEDDSIKELSKHHKIIASADGIKVSNLDERGDYVYDMFRQHSEMANDAYNELKDHYEEKFNERSENEDNDWYGEKYDCFYFEKMLGQLCLIESFNSKKNYEQDFMIYVKKFLGCETIIPSDMLVDGETNHKYFPVWESTGHFMFLMCDEEI